MIAMGRDTRKKRKRTGPNIDGEEDLDKKAKRRISVFEDSSRMFLLTNCR
jgi:hypothetical protein